ncbi:MAG: crosslink repair DNA glycosylase YcaQ family protein [Acidimicrobiales bacterium]
MRKLTNAQARRIALGAQGFGDARPAGRVDARHFRRALDRMTILQLDSVNVCARSHFMPMFSRLGPYDQDALDRWLWESGENHEYLAHEASITSMDHYPLLRYRMTRHRWKAGVQLEHEHPEYLAEILGDVAARGPMCVSDLANPGERTGPWWGYSKGKFALEWLYYTGRLAISKRTKAFVTYYDLAERVVPEEHRRGDALTELEAARQMLLLGAKSHGVGTDRDLADYFRLKMPVARPVLADLVAEGLLELVEVEGYTKPLYLHPEAKRPRSISASTFLSPFDPITWFRPRAEELFGFEYKIEIYVPEAKRQYGYYSLPFLLDEALVGRADLKADRKNGVLLAKSAFVEAGHDPVRVGRAMAEQLAVMADWLGLDRVDVGAKGNAASAVAKALA